MVDGRVRWVALAGLLLAAFTACANVQDRYVATPLNERGHVVLHGRTASGLIISGEEVPSHASKHFGLLQVTFENASSDWVRIRHLTLDFGSAGAVQPVVVPEGPDIDAWVSATLQRNVIRETNDAIALGTLLAIGATVARIGATTGKRDLSVAGSMVALGAAAGLTADGVTHAAHHASTGALYPSSHLLALPIAIPPGLFSKRWLLLYTRHASACIRSVRLDYELDDHGTESVLLPFRSHRDRSEWQRPVCAG